MAALLPTMALADSFVVDFPKSPAKWPNCNQYNETITSTEEMGGSKWTTTNFSNNNNGWGFIKGGSRNFASTATINNVDAIPYKVSKMTVTVDAVTVAKINSIKLYVADNSSFTEAEEIVFSGTIAKGDLAFTITNPEANKFYKFAADCQKGSSNGLISISKFTFDYETDASFVQAPTMNPAAGWVMNGTKVELAAQDGASIFYTTDGTAPTVASTAYTESITVDKDMTIKAIAQLNNNLSEVKESEYSVYPVNSAEAPLTPSQAITLIERGFPSSTEVFVGGTITNIQEVSTKYKNATYTITGEDGGAILVYRGKYLDEADFTAVDQIEVGDKVVVKGKLVVDKETKQIDQYNYIVSIEKAPKAVETPVFSKEAGVLNVGDVVTISCATEGAKIYYTLDNTDPTTSSTEYTEVGISFTEEDEFTLKAIAAKGNDISTVATVEYLVEDPNAKTRTATIIFANQGWESGAGKLYSKDNATIEWTAKNGMKFTTTASSAGTTYPAYFDNKDPKGLRLYGSTSNKNAITVEAPKNYILVSVSTDKDAKFNGSETATTANELFTNFGDNKTKFTFAPAEEATVAYSQMIIVLESVETAVETIEAEEAAPARYFNLQGVEVTNPTNGLYIRVQGKKATKVIL